MYHNTHAISDDRANASLLSVACRDRLFWLAARGMAALLPHNACIELFSSSSKQFETSAREFGPPFRHSLRVLSLVAIIKSEQTTI